MNTAIPGWIALGLFVTWLTCHILAFYLALKRTEAMNIDDWQCGDKREFVKQLFFHHNDAILAVWWFKAIRAIGIYGSISFFFLWLHYASL
jgi:hypothetical protein